MPLHRHGMRRKSRTELEREKEVKKTLDSKNGKRKIRTPSSEAISAKLARKSSLKI